MQLSALGNPSYDGIGKIIISGSGEEVKYEAITSNPSSDMGNNVYMDHEKVIENQTSQINGKEN